MSIIYLYTFFICLTGVKAYSTNGRFNNQRFPVDEKMKGNIVALKFEYRIQNSGYSYLVQL